MNERMVPLRLELKNFLSYGDLQVIDFSKHNLVCLTGKNGHGKSAILDAITWAVWGQARKPNGVSKPDESLLRIGQTKLLVLFEFLLGDDTYRIRREFLKGVGKNNASLEFSVQKSGSYDFVPLTEKAIRLTQRKIDSILRINYDTFINSSFLRQGNSNEFSKKSPRERKVLLTKILGLDQYDSLQQKANDLAKERVTFLKQLVAQEQKNKERLTEAPAVFEKKLYLEEILKKTVSTLEQAKINKNLLDEKRAKLSSQIEEIKKKLDQKKELETSFVEQQKKFFSAVQNWQNNHQKIIQSKNICSGTTLAEAELNFNKLQQETVLKMNLQQETLKISQNLAKLQQELFATFSSQEADLNQQVFQQNLQAQQVRNEVFVIEQDLQRLAEASKKAAAEVVACQNKAGQNCSACGQPLNLEQTEKLLAQNLLLQKDLSAKINAAQDLLQVKQKSVILLQQQTEQLQAKIKKLQQSRVEIQKTHPSLQELQSQLEEANRALQKLSHLEQELAKAKANLELAQKAAIIEQEMSLKQTEQKLWFERVQENKFLIKQLKRSIHEVVQQLGNLDAVKLEYNSLKTSWEALQASIKGLEKEQMDLQQEVALCSAKIKLFEELALENKTIEERLLFAKKEVYDYELLAEAFGKNGIQALLLEETLPEIENATNQVLELISETHAKVFIEPLRDLKKGGSKESLDIIISDINGIRDYEMFSGGEAFRIDFALRVGISKVIANRAGTTLKTLIIDEGFGALDEEGVMLMMNCLYKIADLFEKIIVVSHLPILKEMFPIHFVVSKTASGSKVSVEYRG